MLSLALKPLDSDPGWEQIKLHPTGVQLQKKGTTPPLYRVVFQQYHIFEDASSIECDNVYWPLIKALQANRNSRASMVDSDDYFPDSENEAQMLDKLKTFVNTFNNSVLHRLLHDQRWEDAKRLIDKNPGHLRKVDIDGDTPLHILCREDRLEMVRYIFSILMRRGVILDSDTPDPYFDMNARNNLHWTPLHCACYEFNFRIADFLLKDMPIAVNSVTKPNRCNVLHFLSRWQDTQHIDPAVDMAIGSYVSSSSIIPPTGTTTNPRASAMLSPSSVSGGNFLSGPPNLFGAPSHLHQQLLDILNQLFEAGIDLSARDIKGDTPLHIASHYGSLLIAEWLICNRADVNAINLNQESPLHMAVISKSIGIVELLLGANADVFAKSKQGTPLDLAKQYSSPEITKILQDYINYHSSIKPTSSPHVRFMIPNGEEIIKVADMEIGIPITLSSETVPHEDSSSSSSIDATDTSTLNISTSTSPSNSASFILQSPRATAGVAANSQTSTSTSPSRRSSTSNGSGKTSNNPSTTTNNYSSTGNNYNSTDGSVAPSMFSQGINSPPTNDNLSPLNNSQQSNPNNNNTELNSFYNSLTTTLPALVALPLVPFKHLRRVVETALYAPGKTTLHEAAIRGNRHVVSTLIKARPDLISSKDQHKWTPILYAAAHGYLRLTLELAQSGAEVNTVDLDESGILHFLARNKRATSNPFDTSDLLDKLIANGINLEHPNMFGATAVHEAASRNNLTFLQQLIERGAKVDSVTKNGETPLIYAARENCVDIVNYLLTRGASVEHTGKNGSALDVARAMCNLPVLKVFLFHKTQSNLESIDRKSSPASAASNPPRSTNRLRTSSAIVPFEGASSSTSHSPNNNSNNSSQLQPPNTTTTRSDSGSLKLTTTNSPNKPLRASNGSQETPSLTIQPSTHTSTQQSSSRPRTSHTISSSPNTHLQLEIKVEPHQELTKTLSSPKTVTSNSQRTTLELLADTEELAIFKPGDVESSVSPATFSEDGITSGNSNSGWGTFLSPRRHLTLSVNGSFFDYNKLYAIHAPMLAAFPCGCSISSSIAEFKDQSGFFMLWQHYIAFGHVTVTSAGFVEPDRSFNWKIEILNINSISLTRSLFGSPKLTIVASIPPVADTKSTLATITITRCSRLEALERLLQYLYQNRYEDELLIDDHPLPEMVGSILHPKENSEFHRTFPSVPVSETVLEHFVANLKEEGAFSSKNVFVSQHRLCFGKRNWTQIPFETITTLKKPESKAISIETAVSRFTFTGIPDRDAVFSLIESLWSAQQSENRIVLFGAFGRRSMQLAELLLEKISNLSESTGVYIRWILIHGYHVLDKRQQDALRDNGVEVIWLSAKSGYTALPEVLRYMRKIVLLYLDFDPKFLEVAELLIVHSSPSQIRHLVLVTLALADMSSYLSESGLLLQDLIRRAGLSFSVIQSVPVFMQMLEDEFVDIKRDWRFRFPWATPTPSLAWVDLRDVVDVVSHMALAPQPSASNETNGKLYHIAGPEALNCEELSSIITQMTEQEVRYIGVSIDEIKSILRQGIAGYLQASQNNLSPSTLPSSQILPLGKTQSFSRTLFLLQYLPSVVSHTVSEILAFAQSTSSEIVKSILSKLVFSDKDLDVDTQQYLLIFNDIMSPNRSMHSITSNLTSELVKQKPRTLRAFIMDHLDSFKDKGVYYLTSAQSEAIKLHFCALAPPITTNPAESVIDINQFSRMISTIYSSNSPSFSKRVYRMFDLDNKGWIDMMDYTRTTSIMLNGDPKEQSLLSCDLFDSNRDQAITAQDIADVALEIISILKAFHIEYQSYTIRSLLCCRGLIGYPRDPRLPSIKFGQAGPSLAPTERRLRDTLSVAEFMHVLKLNRGALTNLGFVPSAHNSLGSPSGSTVSDNSQARNVRRTGAVVEIGHPHWELVNRIAIGISLVIQEELTRGGPLNLQIQPSDCDFEHEWRVSSATEPELWTMTEYGPTAFRYLRAQSHITPMEYGTSLGIETILGSMILGRLHSYEEITSTGRSNSFFLRSSNNKFLVKSLPLDEHMFLRKNLFRYVRHLTDYPDSLLVRFCGLYRLKSNSRELLFVVMLNLFDLPFEIHEQYDLKGSTVNRYVGDKMQYFSAGVAMKDMDFHRRIRIGPERKALMLQQAELDAIFMENFYICDYSLLIGFHYLDPNNLDQSTLKSLLGQQKNLRLLLSEPTNEQNMYTDLDEASSGALYVINLIDILTLYSLKKKGESALKSIMHKKSQISAISPTPYRKRFVRFLASILD